MALVEMSDLAPLRLRISNIRAQPVHPGLYETQAFAPREFTTGATAQRRAPIARVPAALPSPPSSGFTAGVRAPVLRTSNIRAQPVHPGFYETQAFVSQGFTTGAQAPAQRLARRAPIAWPAELLAPPSTDFTAGTRAPMPPAGVYPWAWPGAVPYGGPARTPTPLPPEFSGGVVVEEPQYHLPPPRLSFGLSPYREPYRPRPTSFQAPAGPQYLLPFGMTLPAPPVVAQKPGWLQTLRTAFSKVADTFSIPALGPPLVRKPGWSQVKRID